MESLELQLDAMKQEFAQLRQTNELLVKLLQYQGENSEFVSAQYIP